MNLFAKAISIACWMIVCIAVSDGASARKADPAPVEKNFGVGDIVYKEEIKEPLPNAFGGNDIFGRKRTRGLIELRYQGVMPDGRAVFYRRDVSVLTNETTMNRQRQIYGNVHQSGNTATVSGTMTDSATIQALPPDTIEIVVDLGADPVLMVNGAVLRILEATNNRVRVSITPPAR